MRVVNREKFLDLPDGTIYAKGVQWAFESLCIKGESLRNHDGKPFDWAVTNPCWVEARGSDEAFQKLEEMHALGVSYPCEKDYGRDGCFDEDAVFMVFEKDDLIWLKSMIDRAIAVA
jgi:hypothetical protein